MLKQFISTTVYNQQLLTTTSLRLLRTSIRRLGDGDHTRSKAKEKAAEDLKTRKEQRWLDTVASDSGKKNEYDFCFFHIYIFIL